MKKFLILLFTIITLALFVGCSADNGDVNTPSKGSETQQGGGSGEIELPIVKPE